MVNVKTAKKNDFLAFNSRVITIGITTLPS